jgi:hypothetical protein
MSIPGGSPTVGQFRYAFKEGMRGWDVWALQVALNSHQKTFPIVEDGIFGPQTKQCVEREQKNHHLAVVDGICGPATQGAIFAVECAAAEAKYGIPKGLIRGIGLGESGYFFACVSGPNSNGSWDAGTIQDNILASQVTSTAAWHNAFDIRHSVLKTAAELRAFYDNWAGSAPPERIWKAALLNHNFPAAASRWVQGTFSAWRYVAYDANGVKRTYGVDDPAYWVITASGGRLQTCRQWCEQYIERNSIFVTSWA